MDRLVHIGEPNGQDETHVLNSKTMQLQSLHMQTKLLNGLQSQMQQ